MIGNSDLNSYIVDEAGYCISTYERAIGLADQINGVVLELDWKTVISREILQSADHDLFGEIQTNEELRHCIALRLDRIVDVAAKLAAVFRNPQVDERESEKIGFDAAHSIDAKATQKNA